MSMSVAANTLDLGDRPRRRSVVHVLTLALVWLAFACSSIVFTEPSPYDALMMGLIVLLPLVRLADMTPLLTLFLMLWLMISAGAFLAVTQAYLTGVAATHSAISLFLALSSVVIAGFVVNDPQPHTRLILSGYMFAAVIAVLAAIVGYFQLVPGAHELFTKYSRARGTFEDPNVLGPFITPMLLYAVHRMLVGGVRQTFTSTALFVLLLVGLLLTFSRGALINTGIAFAVLAYLEFTTSPTNRRRLKLVLFALLGMIVATGVVAGAMQIPAVADLYQQRSSLELGYDIGPEGRFGGQLKAIDIIMRSPLGLGALEFGNFYHNEDVHNVYLSMFLNAGWLGGITYLVVVITTLFLGMRMVLRATPARSIMIVLFASFVGLVGEGFVIDSDHWRHFYLLVGLIWGLAAAYPPAWRSRERYPPEVEQGLD